MTASNYARSLAKVLKYEGGYSNDAGDPGGATMWGITHIDYDAYRRSKGLKPQDVRKMTTAERDSIYKNKYWTKSRCDELPGGVDFVVFDGAVNSGIGQSVKWLQRSVGVTVDGKIGPATMAAVDAADDKAELVRNICDQRLRFLKSLRHWSIFGKGWSARVKDVRATGLAWIEPDEEASAVAQGAGKAIADEDELIAVAEVEDKPSLSDRVGTAVGFVGSASEGIDSAGRIVEKIKPVSKSKISWGAAALGTTSTATAVANAPPTLLEQFWEIWKSPIWWLVLMNVVLTIWIIYHYWRDHGYGLIRKAETDG